MSHINQAIQIIEELSFEEKRTLLGVLKAKLCIDDYDVLINELYATKDAFENGNKKLETVDELFERIDIK